MAYHQSTSTPSSSNSQLMYHSNDDHIPGGRYQCMRTLRKTLFGKVMLGCDTHINHSNQQTLVAIKLSNTRLVHTKTSFSGEPLLEDPKEEIRLMTKLSANGGHIGILKLLAHINHEHYQWTVLEFCSGGEFFDLIANGGRLPPSSAARYFRQVALAVDFMHSNNVAHLDLSLENLLLDSNDHVKICDFGMAREIKTRVIATSSSPSRSRCTTPPLPSTPSTPTSLTFDTNSPSSMCCTDDDTDTDTDTIDTSREHVELFHGKPGKIGYMAPEVFEGKAFDGRAADVWSTGIMLFMMLTGIPPWKLPAVSDERYRLIMNGQLAKLLHAWNTPIPPLAMDLLSHMLCPAADRWTIQQILKHPFIAASGAPSVPSSSTSTPMVRSLSIQSLDSTGGSSGTHQSQLLEVPASPSSRLTSAAA